MFDSEQSARHAVEYGELGSFQFEEITMAKGQLRGNKEHKKPKQPKAPPPIPVVGIVGAGARPSAAGKTPKK